MMSPFEMNRNLDYLEEVLKTVPAYVEAFRSVFGGEITRQRAAMGDRGLRADPPLPRHASRPGSCAATKSPDAAQRAGYDLSSARAAARHVTTART